MHTEDDAPEQLATAMSELADLRERMERLEAGVRIAAGALSTSTAAPDYDIHEAAAGCR